jgi:hypothetical protein
LNLGASGLNSAQAQKFTAKPRVASTSISQLRRPATDPVEAALGTVGFSC